MSAALIVSLVTVTASLFMAVRAFRSHGLSFENTAWMAVAWLLIIAVVAFIMDRAGA
jgi:hypothetical protein